ncbi:MAG TPA: hypothetical protein PKA00_17540 [Saprospiraceae bacterium]|nr:hypothetical protein [Saprospiraceae bacterium]HMQ84725.1 hypothetical protein [Saprospiraceae bacterium]
MNRWQKKSWTLINGLILFTAGGLRLAMLLQNRSLFMDEASLALCLAEGKLSDFFQPLDHYQYAPPLFMMWSKWSILIAGAGEMVLRFLPFIASLAALYLLFCCCQLLRIRTTIICYPLLFFGFSEMLLRFSTEFKPYSSDTLMALLAIWLCLKKPPSSWNRKTITLWLLLGCAGSWFSMPLVFVLTGVGAYYAYSFWKNGQKRALGQIALLIVAWMLSFAWYYWLVLKTNLAFDPLAQYHQAYFFPLLPTNATDWRQAGALLLGIFKPAAGFTALALITGGSFWLLAFAYWIKKEPAKALLFGLPILATLLASGLGYFSLLPRVSLFMTPLFILGIARGASVLMEKTARYYPFLIWGICLLAVFPSLENGKYFSRPYQVEELKPILQHLQAYRALPIWLDHECVTVYRYYSTVHPQQRTYRLENVHWGKWEEQPVEWVSSLPPKQTFGLIYSHLLSEENRQRMDRELEVILKKANVVDIYEAKGAKVWVLEGR